MSDAILLVLRDLEDRPVNRSALALAGGIRHVGREVRTLAGAGGRLHSMATDLGPVLDASVVNEWRPARLASRARLAPVSQFLKGRRLRELASDLTPVAVALVAEPSAEDLLAWLPERPPRVAVVVGDDTADLDDSDRAVVARADVVIGGHSKVVDGVIGIDAGMVVAPATDASSGGHPLIAVTGVAPDDFDGFVGLARQIRRAVPDAHVGWVRGETASTWDWAFYGRGDLVDLTGSVIAVAPEGSMVVDAVVVDEADRHPLVRIAALVEGRPVIARNEIDRLGATLAAPIVPDEGVLDRHHVDRVVSKILAALDGG